MMEEGRRKIEQELWSRIDSILSDLGEISPRPRLWSAEQVLLLWAGQMAPRHAYTCANRDEPPHVALPGCDLGMLVPTVFGLICPFCDYRQEWSHETGGPPHP